MLVSTLAAQSASLFSTPGQNLMDIVIWLASDKVQMTSVSCWQGFDLTDSLVPTKAPVVVLSAYTLTCFPDSASPSQPKCPEF